MITPIIPTTVPPTSAIPKVPPIPNKIIPNICIFIHLSFYNMLIKGLQPGDCRRSYIEERGLIYSATLFSVWKWPPCHSFSISVTEKYFVYIISYLLRIFIFIFHTGIFIQKETSFYEKKSVLLEIANASALWSILLMNICNDNRTICDNTACSNTGFP